MRYFSLICIVLLMAAGPAAGESVAAQELPDATDIVRRADQHVRGESSRAELFMKMVRPDWTREMGLKFWSKGNDYALILVTSPARDRGTTCLLRGDEVWNYRPDIDRVIKLPPSMMSQSWMGTDFTNDDLVRESSIVEDYYHEIVGDTFLVVDTTVTGGGRRAWEIRLTPKPEAAVVWGEIRLWIGQEHYLQLHAEYYDEDSDLVNVMEMSQIQEMGGRLMPTKMVMRPVDKEGHRTIMQYEEIEFNIDIDESFFSQQNMKRVRP
jgi:outer membrane lipoprotein-sorting protein